MLEKLVTVEGYELITIRQAAEMCGVQDRTVHNWMIDGRLPIKFRAGRTILLDKQEVKAASDSYQKTKPRSGEPVEIKNAA